MDTRLASGSGVTHDLTWRIDGPGYAGPTELATGQTDLTHAFDRLGQFTLEFEVIADTNFVKPERYGANVDSVSWTVNVGCPEDPDPPLPDAGSAYDTPPSGTMLTPPAAGSPPPPSAPSPERSLVMAGSTRGVGPATGPCRFPDFAQHWSTCPRPHIAARASSISRKYPSPGISCRWWVSAIIWKNPASGATNVPGRRSSSSGIGAGSTRTNCSPRLMPASEPGTNHNPPSSGW